MTTNRVQARFDVARGNKPTSYTAALQSDRRQSDVPENQCDDVDSGYGSATDVEQQTTIFPAYASRSLTSATATAAPTESQPKPRYYLALNGRWVRERTDSANHATDSFIKQIWKPSASEASINFPSPQPKVPALDLDEEEVTLERYKPSVSRKEQPHLKATSELFVCHAMPPVRYFNPAVHAQELRSFDAGIVQADFYPRLHQNYRNPMDNIYATEDDCKDRMTYEHGSTYMFPQNEECVCRSDRELDDEKDGHTKGKGDRDEDGDESGYSYTGPAASGSRNERKKKK